ncbi:MAG: hypothetical protein AAGD10_20705 [Myxococcota bacterium]
MKTPKHVSPCCIVALIAVTGCGEDVSGDGETGAGDTIGNPGHEQASNFGPCSWGSSGLLLASGDFAVLGPEEDLQLVEPSRLLNLNADNQDAIAVRSPARIWSGSGGSFELTCGVDVGLIGTVGSQEAGGGGCVEGSRLSLELTPSGAGVWQGSLSVERASFLVGFAMPSREEGGLNISFLARAREPGQGAVCE